jgi:hypothetical protein
MTLPRAVRDLRILPERRLVATRHRLNRGIVSLVGELSRAKRGSG